MDLRLRQILIRAHRTAAMDGEIGGNTKGRIHLKFAVTAMATDAEATLGPDPACRCDGSQTDGNMFIKASFTTLALLMTAGVFPDAARAQSLEVDLSVQAAGDVSSSAVQAAIDDDAFFSGGQRTGGQRTTAATAAQLPIRAASVRSAARVPAATRTASGAKPLARASHPPTLTRLSALRPGL